MSDGNPTRGTACNRREERHRIQRSGDAFVEFELPQGRKWCLPLLDVSSSGVCFGLDEELSQLQTGVELPDVLLRVDRREIRTALTVLHVTVGLSTGMICGARISPHGDADRATLTAVVAELQRSAPAV